MKNLLKSLTLASVILMALPVLADNHELVILHTNDTHSQIDPTDKGFGGVFRRMTFVDSVRASQPNVLLIDAGDAVQGTLFFTLYGGDVEMNVMNSLGYDIQILGNHDFDNGMEKLINNVKSSNSTWISSNYQFEDSLAASLFVPYKLYDFNEAKIGFIGLNLNPSGMIAEGNAAGVVYLDAIEIANSLAKKLKNEEGANLVIAVSHLGYDNVPSPSDKEIIANSENIDILLGGHSHTLIPPGSGMEWVKNSQGKPVLITQNGKSGEYISEITINLDSISTSLPTFRQVKLDESYDRGVVDTLNAIVAPYRNGVDNLMNEIIGTSEIELPNDQPALLNFLSDFVNEKGSELIGRPVDLALMNRGSLRRGLPKGNITKGQIISMQPFTNKIVVLEIAGSDLLEAMKVFAMRDGDGISYQAQATYNPSNHQLQSFSINNQPINPNHTYTISTIDYLANGGDYMLPLKNGKQIATSTSIVYDDLINYILTTNLPLHPSTVPRFLPVP